MEFFVSIQDGVIRIWNTNLVQQRLLPMDDTDHSFSQSTSSKRKIWVTDATVMKNVNKLAICTTNMDIYFYDMSTPVYTPQFHLCGKLMKDTVAFHLGHQTSIMEAFSL